MQKIAFAFPSERDKCRVKTFIISKEALFFLGLSLGLLYPPAEVPHQNDLEQKEFELESIYSLSTFQKLF